MLNKALNVITYTQPITDSLDRAVYVLHMWGCH